MRKLTFRSAAIVMSIALLFGLGLSADAAAQSMSIQRFLELPSAVRADVARGMSEAERRALHEQFRALPESVRAGFLASRRNTGGGHSNLGPNPTIQYDTGVAAGVRVPNGNAVGNRFNTGFGNPHTISTATVQVGGTFGGSVSVSVFGAPAGSMAPLLTLVNTSPTIGVAVPVPLPGLTNLSGTFMIGINQSGTSTSPSTTWEHVQVDTNSGGLGFHGMSIAPGGAGGFNASPVVSPGVPFNAIIRATGNNLPVELMDFSVEP